MNAIVIVGVASRRRAGALVGRSAQRGASRRIAEDALC
jgi:hypothetical protein